MAEKMEFRSKLSGILELAVEHDYKLTCDQVEKYFEEDQLNKEQMELVFDYLLAQKVAVKGYVKTGGSTSSTEEKPEVLTADEEAYLAEYLTDLEAIRGAREGELVELYRAISKGDTLAKSRLTEIYLKRIVEIGKDMNHPEIFLGDIIQEGNVSLMIALESFPAVDGMNEDEMQEMVLSYIEAEVRQGIQMLIEETGELKGRDQKMVEQVTNLDENITKLTEELGRKVTIDELALYTELSEEEILEILKLTGEEVEDGEEEDATGIHAKDLGIQVLDK